jgi:hypothetical protein
MPATNKRFGTRWGVYPCSHSVFHYVELKASVLACDLFPKLPPAPMSVISRS